MKAFTIALPLILVSLFLNTACVDSETLIKLNRDGTGLIEQTTLPPALLSTGLGALLGGKDNGDQPNLLLKEKEWLNYAKNLGEDVTLVSLEEYKAHGKTGARAVYKFKDINKLQMSTDGLSLESLSGAGKSVKVNKSDRTFGFKYTPGTPALLKIKVPQPTPADEKKAKETSKKKGKNDDLKKIIMGQAIADTHIRIIVEVEGNIRSTNATHREKSQIILTDLDFQKASKKPEGMKKLQALEHVRSVDEGKALLKGLDGIRIEEQPEIDVEF